MLWIELLADTLWCNLSGTFLASITVIHALARLLSTLVMKITS
jgi:hypothetical protein